MDVIMPQMGESIAEGTLSRWLKAVGDEVKRDEPIFEISTDKVDAEIPAPAAGILAEILVQQGQTVAVQTVVARLETDKAAYATAGAGAPAGAPAAAAPAAPAPAAAAAPAPVSSAPSQPSPAAPATSMASGNGNSFEERVRTRSSPLVRKIAAEHGLEIAAMQGSGIAGRVTKKDLLPYLAGGAKQGAAAAHAAAPPSMHAPTGADSHGPPAESWPGDLVEPMTPMRQRIAQHMTQSRRTSAHVTSFFEIDLTRVARIRAKQRATVEASTGYKLSYLPFIISAVVAGLKKFPIMNAAVSGNNIIYRKQYNIGIAVALDWGLIVPVIKKADDLSLSGLTRALNDLASRARAKKLDPREVQDGTFTITNPGIFGSLMGTPIISQPQVAILGVGAIEKRPKVITGSDGEDTIAIRTCAFFSISFDHRIIDGAVADEFLAFVKKSLESFPETGI
ncbi:MAG TPA: dihydrolipoamide acetyltransferase family protein [Gemmatimonadaceae bacterium]|nr:dihydrolipoamide acetyltransferase family protein [Gemmatimonadaceae bacterium]